MTLLCLCLLGSPDVTMTGVREDIRIHCSSLGNGRYKCEYTPAIAGAYLLNIVWNERQLRGSPYKVNVIPACHPQKVIVSGEGLKGGMLGREIDVRIDTRKAGAGG